MTKRIKTQHEYVGTKRGLVVSEAESHSRGCVKLTANIDGRTTKWVVCAVGAKGTLPELNVQRGGRRGGIRAAGKASGGIVACSSLGQNSKCVRAPYGVTLFPGGGAKLKKLNVPVYSGFKKRRRK